MFRKIFSIILVFLLCCSTTITTSAQTEHSHIEENGASNVNEETAIINAASSSSEMIIANTETIISPDYLFTATADPEYLEWLYGAPDEIISASTIDLLEYFLETPFMGQQVFSCLSTFSTPNNSEIDFSCHEAFRELISREDFLVALESYAERILNASDSSELEINTFEKLLVEPSVESLASDLECSADSYPNLQSIYTTSGVVTTSVGDLVGTLNDIDYYSAGTISTVNGHNVEVCTPHREWTSSEIADINYRYDYAGNSRLDDPTTVYNCHSYAWYKYSTANPY